VNQAISSFREAHKRIKESSIPVAEWLRLQKELEETVFSIQQVEENLDIKTKEKNRLDRLNRVKGALAERRTVKTRIEEMHVVLLLPEDFDERRKTASSKLQNALEAKARANAKLARIKEELAQLNDRTELVDNEEAILAIHKELGAVEKTIIDRPQIDGKRRQLRNEAEQILKGIRPGIDINDAEQLRPQITKKKWISGLTQKYGLLNQKKETAMSTLQTVEDQLEANRKELNELPLSNFDIHELKAAVAAARKVGNLEYRLADSQKRATDDNKACGSELSRLGRFSGTIESLSKIAVPVPETLDKFEKLFDEQSDKIRKYGYRQTELEDEQKKAKQDLKELLMTSQVFSIPELKEARLMRTTGWNLIKNKYIEKIDVEKDIADFVNNSDLSVVYEQKVDFADQISDGLRLAAEVVAKRAELEARIQILISRINEIIIETQKTNKDYLEQQKEWNSIWEQLGVVAGTPREMKQWLLRVERLLTNVKSANTVFRDAKSLFESCKTLKQSLSQQIEKFDASIILNDMGLEAMIILCEQRVEQEEDSLECKRHLEQLQGEMEMAINRIRKELKAIETDKINWSQEWEQAVNGLGLNPDVHPEQATEAAELLCAFFEKFDQSEELRKRIYGMDQVVEKFEKKVFGFSDSIYLKRDGQEASSIAAQLSRDLNKARETRATLKKTKIQEKEALEEIEGYNITIQTAQEQLVTLCEQANVGSIDELESAGEKSQRMRNLHQKLDMLEQGKPTANGVIPKQ
jgi:uncharacterized protein YhaN